MAKWLGLRSFVEVMGSNLGCSLVQKCIFAEISEDHCICYEVCALSDAISRLAVLRKT